VFFLFDLLYLDGEDVSARPLIDRKARLAALLSNVNSPLHYSDPQRGQGRAFHEKACARLCQDNRIAQKRGRGVGWRDG
jgi:bifunctional non-homologous end joining protein LigD